MSLERLIALLLLFMFLVYGYTAWFAMDDLLPPILRRNPIWPSSFPKILAAIGFFISAAIVLKLERTKQEDLGDDIDYRKWRKYNYIQAILIILLMLGYTLFLRPIGFIAATALFLALGGFALGERRYIMLVIISIAAAFLVWYLVDAVLGIYLKPYPAFISHAFGSYQNA